MNITLVSPTVAMTAMLATVALAAAQPLPERESGTSVYQSLLKSTAWIHSNRGGGRLATGSGALIDRRRLLVLTNYHVVGEVDQAKVLFPAYRNSELIAERQYYQSRVNQLGVSGRVVARDKKRDLALIQLEKVSPGVQALPLAEKSPRPGQSVHSIGNPGGSGGLWVYTPGRVRQVYLKQWRAKLEDREARFEAQVVETDSATNPGDSGGPLVNDAAELVAVTEGGAVNAQLLSTFIDVTEVKAFLAAPEVKKITGPEGQQSGRDQALTVKDDGKFFTAETVAKVNADLRYLFRRFGVDLLIETHQGVAAADVGRVKDSRGSDREAYYHEWAKRRVKAENGHGVIILVTREPRYLYVYRSEDAAKALDDETIIKAREALRAKFRENKYDEGLTEAVKLIRERLEGR